MRVLLITSYQAPEVLQLIESEDKLRQCSARLGCTPDKLRFRIEELDESVVTILTGPEKDNDPITGIDYETGEPVVSGPFIICRYDDRTGLMRNISDEEIVKFASGYKEHAITTFHASKARFEEQRAKRERIENSPEGLRKTAAFYAYIINNLRCKYADTYANNSDGKGQIYRDILADNPEIERFVREHPNMMPGYAKYLD